jgi:hypothetical protein
MILPIKYNLLSDSQGIDAGLLKLFNVPIDADLTFKEALAVIVSVLAGKSDISGSTVTFRDVADTKNRVSATMSGSERTAVILDGL